MTLLCRARKHETRSEMDDRRGLASCHWLDPEGCLISTETGPQRSPSSNPWRCRAADAPERAAWAQEIECASLAATATVVRSIYGSPHPSPLPPRWPCLITGQLRLTAHRKGGGALKPRNSRERQSILRTLLIARFDSFHPVPRIFHLFSSLFPLPFFDDI